MGRKVYLPTWISLIFMGSMIGKYTIVPWIRHGLLLIDVSEILGRFFPEVDVSEKNLRAKLGIVHTIIAKFDHIPPT